MTSVEAEIDNVSARVCAAEEHLKGLVEAVLSDFERRLGRACSCKGEYVRMLCR